MKFKNFKHEGNIAKRGHLPLKCSIVTDKNLFTSSEKKGPRFTKAR